jgi:hypothetical protein
MGALPLQGIKLPPFFFFFFFFFAAAAAAKGGERRVEEGQIQRTLGECCLPYHASTTSVRC